MTLIRTITIASFLFAVGCGTTANRDEGTATEGSTSQSLVTRRSWNGGAASFAGGTSTSWMWLDVNEGPDGAWLSFSRNSVDPTSWKCETVVYPPKGDMPPPPPGEWCRYTRATYEYGSGSIAANDFRTNGGAARLATTLNAASFWGERCVWDEEVGTGTCGPLSPSGSINVEWKKTNQFSQRSNGTNESRYGKYMFKWTGNFRSSSADATGTAFGQPIAATGTISNTHGVNVVKDFFVTK